MGYADGTDWVARAVGEGRAFTVTTDLQNISGQLETALLYIKNPSGSGINIETTKFLVGGDSSSSRAVYRVYDNPTVTADGTSLTIRNTLISDSPQASICEAYMLPTVTDFGALLNMAIAPSNSPSRGINRHYYIHPGHSILVTTANSVSNVKTFSDCYWLEGV